MPCDQPCLGSMRSQRVARLGRCCSHPFQKHHWPVDKDPRADLLDLGYVSQAIRIHGHNFQMGLNLTSKGGKGITVSLRAVGVSWPIMGEMLFVDGVISAVILAENRVGLRSATFLAAY